MEVEIRKQGKKKKYYLAHSFREGKKVKKIRRYLGVDLSAKKIEHLKKRAEEIIRQQLESYKIIRDPLQYTLTPRELKLLKELEEKSDYLVIKRLSKDQWKIFTELFTYNTNAIEGSEITQNEVKNIIEKNQWPRNITKEDISETYGVAEAVRYIGKIKEHLSLKLIKRLHQIIFKNSRVFAGKFRGKGIEVGIKDATGNLVHIGAPSNRIYGLLEELFLWYNQYRNIYPPLILASVVHNQFENIHPFQDGNGRVGRLLLNNILLKHGLPPINISFNRRKEYYYALKEYQKKGDLRPTIQLILKEYKELKKRLGVYKK